MSSTWFDDGDVVYETIDEKQTNSKFSITSDEFKVTRTHTYDTGGFPILDYRWESFDSVQLKHDVISIYKESSVSKYIQISFSLKVKEVQIFLCDRNYFPKHSFGNCYWLGLGSYNGDRHYIRKCVEGAIPKESYPTGDCAIFKQTHKDKNLTSETGWHHFTIRKERNNILAWKYNSSVPFFNYTDEDYNPFETKYIFVRPMETGYMKIHELKVLPLPREQVNLKITFNNLLETNCLAFYVKVCDGCVLKLLLRNDYQELDSHTTERDSNWQEISLKASIINWNSNVVIKSTGNSYTNEDPYWYVSNTIRRCGNQDIPKKIGRGCCYAIKYPDYKICTSDLKKDLNATESNCPANTFGQNCIPCSIFPNCQKIKTCDKISNQTVCSCSDGYTGQFCDTGCTEGRYGFQCKEKCGKCTDPTCNIMDGTCTSCKKNFREKICKKAILPILEHAPTITNTGHTSVYFTINKAFDGEFPPTAYTIQYRKFGEYTFQHWNTFSSDSITLNQAITHLKSNTEYEVRIILMTANNSYYDDEENTPIMRFRTTCKNLAIEYFNISMTNTSIHIILKEHQPHFEETCPISRYSLTISIEDIQDRTYKFLRRYILSDNFIVSYDEAEPYTNYLIRLIDSDENIVSEYIERSKQGTPNGVENITIKTYDTNVSVKWDDPIKKNGNITYYYIKYGHTRYGNCGQRHSPIQYINLNVTSRNISIGDLVPFSEYVIKISAFTIYEGPEVDTSFETEEAANISENEFPNLFFTDFPKTLEITIKFPCENVRGPIKYHIKMICNDDWCASKSQNISDIDKDTNITFNTDGKTNYTIVSILHRKNLKSRTENFYTMPTAPGSVRNATIYSMTNQSIYLRWLAPYPPNGETELYKLRYRNKYVSHSFRSEEVQHATAFCKLWPEQICVEIDKLSKSRTYYFWIKAKNKDVHKDGEDYGPIEGVTEEGVPLEPEIINHEWNQDYGITIKWKHPYVTNGQIQKFLFYINDKVREESYDIKQDQMEYKYQLLISQNLTSMKVNVSVVAKNNLFQSEKSRLETYTPPKKPVFKHDMKPEIADVQNTTFNIQIPGSYSISNVEGNRSIMYIIITDVQEKITRGSVHPDEGNILEKIKVVGDHSWVITEMSIADINLKNNWKLTVGTGKDEYSKINENLKLKNRYLTTGDTYKISVLLENTYMNHSRHTIYYLMCNLKPGTVEKPNYWFALFIIPLILIIVCATIFIKRNRSEINASVLKNMQRIGLASNSNDLPLTPLVKTLDESPKLTSPPIKRVTPGNIQFERSPENKKYTRTLKINKLDRYIRDAIENGLFENQHAEFPRGQTKPWIYGTKSQNKSKNRYSNLAAYDHTRVKLKTINKDPYSDYINANYIDGYDSPKVYIATQGPKSTTLNDFWRMIWEENVEYIIMTANVVEAGKKKVEKYWPDINEEKQFGDVKVEYLRVDVMANYEMRHFNAYSNGEKRKVKQLHFLAWPDHGVPLYAQSLSPFLKKMLTIPQGKSPIVVHCSAGVGRTGSLILCDICLRMAAREGKVDPFYYLYKIREQRVNMVDNVEQYKLVHLVLLQCLVAPKTGISCGKTMEENINNIIAEKLDEEMEYLDETLWQDEAMRNINLNTAEAPIVHSKNRFKDIIPDPVSRIFLSPYPSSDQTSGYINAIAVDGFATPSKFIVTQNPLPNTIGDFWRLIQEKNVTTIVCLNQLDTKDKTVCNFYPTSNKDKIDPVPYLKIQYTGEDVNEYYKVYNMTLINNEEEDEMPVKVLQLNNWKFEMLHPESPVDLLMVYEEMNRLGRTSDTILIACHDGAKASGLFVAMCFVVDQVKMEQICDVCLAVRTVRHSRQDFVRDRNQFSFLYKSALEYVRQFDMYSNFTPMNN